MGVALSNFLLQADSAITGCPGSCAAAFLISPWRETARISGQLVPVFDHPHNKVFSCVYMEFPDWFSFVFLSLYPLLFVLSLGYISPR